MHDVEQLRINVTRLCRGLLMGFLALSVWLAYWHVVRAPELRADTQNPRTRDRLKVIQPGKLMTHDGVTILTGERGEEGWYFEYPGHETYCHLTGYNLKTGLQATLHDALYGLGKYEDPIVALLRGQPQGCQITLTIDAKAQEVAHRLMQDKVGAVVAMDPRDGSIRTLVSSPGYDPPRVLESPDDFMIFQNHPDKPELNRALLGQYAPGSVLKILTAAAALDMGVVKPDDKFTCAGKATISGSEIRCRLPKGHGRISFTWALADSCNVIFAEVGRGMGPAKFREYVSRFHLLDAPALSLPARGGRMANMAGPKAEVECAEAAFGQGATLTSPLAIARMTATIAAGGAVPVPKLLEQVKSARGRLLARLKPEAEGQAVSAAAAKAVTKMMVETVNRGTAGEAAIRGVAVAGKTGSAENPTGLPHAWFTCFAPADNPTAVVTVVVENGGAGGEVAGPIARQVLEALLREQEER
ncbi:hypothetical protein LLH03_09845 [bacterium]|nr:hypothetical protein [bacterium]